jgi:hypothetical protein
LTISFFLPLTRKRAKYQRSPLLHQIGTDGGLFCSLHHEDGLGVIDFLQLSALETFSHSTTTR